MDVCMSTNLSYSRIRPTLGKNCVYLFSGHCSGRFSLNIIIAILSCHRIELYGKSYRVIKTNLNISVVPIFIVHSTAYKYQKTI